MNIRSFELVTHHADLRRVSRRWSQQPAIAVDTEFVRERTYYPRLGLIQVADQDSITLLDTVALNDLDPLKSVFTKPSVVKVLHACGEDAQVIHSSMGIVPSPIFDTQLGAGFCGLGYPRSYSSLVHLMFGIELDKSVTRSDWLRRPLRPRQLEYAADDVLHLLPVYSELVGRARKANRESWITEESSRLADPSRFLIPPEFAYRRIRGRGRLDPAAHARLRSLAAWRDTEARKRDIPRGFVFSDKELLILARKAVRDPADVARLDWLGVRRRSRYQKILIEKSRLEPLDPEPYEPDLRQHESAMRSFRHELQVRATALGISPDLLASKKAVTDLFARHASSADQSWAPPWHGWRRVAAGDLVSRALGTIA